MSTDSTEQTPNQTAPNEPQQPQYTYRDITLTELAKWLCDGNPALVGGKWKNKVGGLPPFVAVHMAEWNDGRPFVVPGSLFASYRLRQLADADGKLLGTKEEVPENAADQRDAGDAEDQASSEPDAATTATAEE